MIRKYKVTEDVLERFGYEGIEKLEDSPVGRHLYRGGEVIELEDAKAAPLKASGIIVAFQEPPAEVVSETVIETPSKKPKKEVIDGNY